MTAVDRPDNGQDEGRGLAGLPAYWRALADSSFVVSRVAGSDYARGYSRGVASGLRSAADHLDIARAGAGEQQREQVAAVLRRHAVGAFAGCDTACSCDRRWRTNIAYREHLADELLALLGGPQPDGGAVKRIDQLSRNHFGLWVEIPDRDAAGYLYVVRDEFHDGYPSRYLVLVHDDGTGDELEFTDSDPAGYPRTMRTPCTARADREASDPGPQCPSSSHGTDGWRCEHRAGHDGGHRNGEVEWP